MRYDDMHDQAAGLRHILARSSARVVTVVGACSGLGTTSVVVNLATILAHGGREVLVLDEHLAHNNVANSMGLRPRFDLLNVVRGDMRVRDVTLLATSGVQVLPVARAMQVLPKMNEIERERLSTSMVAAASGMDAVVVDAESCMGFSFCASLSGNEPLLMVLNASASSITESYAMLKQFALQHGRTTFDIVVNKVSDEWESRALFNNISQVAQRYLGVQLNYLGNIPVDKKLQRATQLRRPVVEAYPDAAAAYALKVLVQQLMPARREVAGGASMAQVMQRLIWQTPPHNVVSAN
jgi:flagellar biosynthesis protein FlhG